MSIKGKIALSLLLLIAGFALLGFIAIFCMGCYDDPPLGSEYVGPIRVVKVSETVTCYVSRQGISCLETKP